MSASDWIALVAVLISLLALVISSWNRERDITREERAAIRARVWAILSMEPGIRTVLALDDNDGEFEKRKRLLERTAVQLKSAGAQQVGTKLADVLNHDWSDRPTPEVKKAREAAREEFINSLTQFMSPAPRRPTPIH